ncbi:HYD1 signature containing ADP-ribosyltransferase family protein [Streptomyces sp. 135]|uniref:HYD1 signature containing ADP-ribosyltransferase family protein n=1 Tax=Streptomyces sp. 135 TaxID=2838850 RepID=UPI001CC0CA71|nr:HYD1 signature containing ADP-ribosyltransferase family protein [Streptomyces sp. 135]
MNLPAFGLPRSRGTHRPARPRTSVPPWRRRVAAVTGFVLLPGLLSPVAFAADIDPLGRPKLDAPRPSKVTPLTAKVNKKTAKAVAKSASADKAAAERARTQQDRTVTWPKSGKATLTLPKTGKTTAKPGNLPLTLTAPQQTKNNKQIPALDRLQVRVLDQQETKKLGIKGIALTVTSPKNGGAAQLGLNYEAFASAYGGDWAGRLQLLRLPDCARTAPARTACRTRTPLEFTNHRKDEQLTAPLTFPTAAKSGTAEDRTMVLALAAGTKSGSGDYKATPLAASSTWEAGGSSGSFTWSYPLRTPPAAAGPKPDLSISYDSGSVDGRTASTNNQGTAIGEGFDLTSSYIERKYGSCDDDGQDKKYDLCWKYDNASLVLNGQATELVKDDTSGTWRLKNDDASTVTRHTGADNGDDDGEYWTLTTGDGTTYTFGLNKLEGAGAEERTQSVWTVPVFGDDENEPGHKDGSSFSGRDKKQAWRWNLDLVQDTHANTMTYWYQAEHNNYDKLGDDTTGTDYTRGGYLKEIRYGQRASTLFSAKPAASNKVTFTYAERCLATGTGCDALTEDKRDNWPDVPYDTVCKDGDKCTGNVGPSFFTRKRMTGITTYAWNAAAATPAYAAVDAWELKQLYLDPGDTGDTTDQSLWLDEIKHTGKRGTDLALDPVKFTHAFLPNRVDGASDDILSLDKPRLRTVTSEAGAQTIISYAAADCVAGQTKPKVDENTRRCYPVHWSPNGEKTPILDWFHKYPVTAVSTTDPQGGSEAVQHTYQYSGGGAWHYNDDPMTPAKERTWSLWRGFGKVTHLTGDKDSAQLKEVSVYLRGMNGDRVLGTDNKTPDPDKRKSVKVTGIKAADITDSDQYAGFTRESVTYNGDTEVSGTINDPWSKRTATQHKSYADTEAYYVRTAASHARTHITSTATPRDRIRTTKTTYDDYGMAETVEDNGDDAIPGDETCTRTWYARNDDKDVNINALVSRTRTVAKTCAVTDANLDLPADSDKPGDVIADTATAYDNPQATTWSATQKPTLGEATWTGRAKAYSADNAPTWQKTATTSYDTLGRPLVVKDTHDLTTATTTYTPAAAGPLTSTTVTNAAKHQATTTLDFATGAALKTTDPNNKVTETDYDSLGRVTKVWLPNRSKALNKTPNYVYDYKVTSKDLSWVSTGTLKGDGSGYNTTYEFYDSLLRARQTQTPTPVGGRLVSLTLYDDRGLAVSAQGDIWDNTSPPSATVVQTEGSQAPVQTDTTYDGAGRATKAVTKNYGVTRWTTNSTYTGDTVTTSAPTGGQATAEVTNALGQLTQRREYGGPQPTGTDFTTTDYTYTPAGQQKTLTGPDEAKWSYSYDLFGRQVAAADPDSGTTRTTYDSLDRPVTTTDEEDNKLLTEYDDLNRKTSLWQTDKTDANKLAAWTFDTLAKGQQDTAVRYDGGTTGKVYTQKVTQYDSLYQVMGNQLTLPDDDPLVKAGVPKTFPFTTGYRLDGTISQASQPAVAGLTAETVGYTYNDIGQQLKSVGTNGYLQNAVYSPQGDLRQQTLGMSDASSAKKAYITYDYEPGTRRLTRSYVTDDVHGYMPQELKYTQDDAGNVTSIFDATTQGGTTKPDHQCFTYDGHRRLTEAWTPKTADCANAGRNASNIDGAAPYWTSYTYNQAGQRKTETQHASSGGDKTTDYTYRTDQNQPHPLVKTETGGKTQTYTYDKTGNTTSRPDGAAQQTLTWNTEGKLARTTEGSAQTDYLYDASGELLIRRAKGDGDTVLYLGATEVRLTVKGTTKTLSGSRYYTANGQTVAVRTTAAGTSGTRISYLAADHHGTAGLALDATTYATTKRYTTPFGAPRGEKTTNWPDDKAFLGKPADTATGLTHVGAREYDPNAGQFISVDPLLQTEIHQTLNGYSYGAQNPLSNADPSGLGLKCAGGDPACPKHGNDGHEANGGGGYGGGGGGGRSGGTAPTRSTGHTAQPSSGPQCLPISGNVCAWHNQPYTGPSDKDSWFTNAVDVALKDVILPDFEAWKDCWNDKGFNSACGSAAMDLPWGKPLKGLKLIRKALESGEEVSDGAKKAKKGIPSGCKCFLPGTDVLMADDSTKDIEDVKVGDKVLATDPVSGESGPREVTRLIVTESDKRFNTLSIATDDGIKKLTATYEHPFWSASEHRWVEAGDLRPGMSLLTDDGDTVIVTGNYAFTKQARTYNLTVEGLHTYYVLAGETPVLVHNSGGCPPETLIHYTDEAGMNGIVGSKKLNASTKEASPKDARYGDGQYLSDIAPGTKTCGQLSRCFLGHPFSGRRFTNYVEIDVRGLNVVKGRDNVYVIPNQGPLDLNGRIIGHGAN